MSQHGTPTASLVEALRGVLAQVAEPPQVLKTILDAAVGQTGADRGVFVEVARDGRLSYQVLHRFDRHDLSGQAGRYSRSIFEKVISSGRGVHLANALDDPRFMREESIQGFRLVSILCMPILVSERVAAMVHLEHNRPGHFTKAHEDLLGSLLEIAGPVLEALHAGRDLIRERDSLRLAEGRARQELEESREVLSRDWSFGRYLGRSAAVRDLEAAVHRASATSFPVLLIGETGTGKSILARVIHHAGSRSKRSFVTVFCPSLEKGMVESELFGHRKGAFTSATADRVGKVQTAERGTLFLDEIGELPLEIQPKLLRLLQERTYEPVGDAREREADVRVIAATSRDLEAEVRAGRFRRDLLERLNFLPIGVPPLRERCEDIPLLLRHFLDSDDAGRWVEVTVEGLEYLSDPKHAWPGNIRQIQQIAARLAARGTRDPVERRDLEPLIGSAGVFRTPGRGPTGRHLDDPFDMEDPLREAPAAPSGTSALDVEASSSGADLVSRGAAEAPLEAGLPALLARAERSCLEEAMRRYPRLTRSQLAEKLKISESALYKKMRIYGLGG